MTFRFTGFEITISIGGGQTVGKVKTPMQDPHTKPRRGGIESIQVRKGHVNEGQTQKRAKNQTSKQLTGREPKKKPVSSEKIGTRG